MNGVFGVYVYVPVILFSVLFVAMSGKTEKQIGEGHYVVRESRRFLVISCISTLIGCFLALWVLVSGEEIEAWLVAGVLAVFWLPGFGGLLCCVNRKIVVMGEDIIYQSMWGRKRRYKIRDLRMKAECTAMTYLSPKAKELVVTTKDGNKVFQFEQNMINAAYLMEQFRKLHMERLEQSVKNVNKES